MIPLAPFETFREHAERDRSDEPYNDCFIRRCREEALKYNGEDKILSVVLLKDLKKCVPRHFWNEVFDGISI